MSDLARKLNYLPIWRNYLSVWDANMFHPSGDRWLYLLLHRLGLMGQLERGTIEHFLRPGMSILDVGGNIGLYTILFSHLVGPHGNVVAIEPIPELSESLQKSITRNHIENVKVLPIAAGSTNGSVYLSRDALNSGNNWISTTARPDGAVQVPIQRLDSFTWERPFDFIKIDVQGWELDVLKGLSKLIPLHHHPIIMCEIAERSIKEAGSSLRELRQLLMEYRYQIYLPQRENKEIVMRPLTWEALEDMAGRTHYFDIIAMPSDS